MQVGTSGEAFAAHAGDLLTGLDGFANLDVQGGHVAVNGDGAVFVLDANPVTETGSWPESITVPSSTARIGVPMAFAMSTPLCIVPQRGKEK